MKKFLPLFTLGFIMLAAGFCSAQEEVKFDKYTSPHKGLTAENFRYVTADSMALQDLYSIKTPLTMLFFYDPGCPHCKEEIKNMKNSEYFNHLIEADSLTVVSVPPDISVKEWADNLKKMPQQWVNAWSCDTDVIVRKYLWKVPTVFILDRDKRVVKREEFREE